MAETEFGINVEKFTLNKDSCDLVNLEEEVALFEILEVNLIDATLGVRIDNCKFRSFGINGGKSGGIGKVIINPEQ